MAPRVMLIYKVAWIEVVTQIKTLTMIESHMEGRVQIWMTEQLEAWDRRVQEYLYVFESRIT